MPLVEQPSRPVPRQREELRDPQQSTDSTSMLHLKVFENYLGAQIHSGQEAPKGRIGQAEPGVQKEQALTSLCVCVDCR